MGCKIKYAWCLIALICYGLSVDAQNSLYVERYPKECSKALDFYETNKIMFEEAGEELGLSGKFLFAIVAPEFTQFSHLSNFIESNSLKVFYVQGGRAYSDFSIGYFQMKPSFIERMEDSLRCNNGLMSLSPIFLIEDSQSRQARVTRVKRLEKWEWQLRYLTLFCILLEDRFSSKNFSNEEEKLQFYASAYNSGFHRTEQEIERVGQIALFPHFSTPKYRYTDIALWFFRDDSHNFLEARGNFDPSLMP